MLQKSCFSAYDFQLLSNPEYVGDRWESRCLKSLPWLRESSSAPWEVSAGTLHSGLEQEGRMESVLQWPWADFWVVLPESSWCPPVSGLQAGTGAQSPGDTSRSLRRL